MSEWSVTPPLRFTVEQHCPRPLDLKNGPKLRVKVRQAPTQGRVGHIRVLDAHSREEVNDWNPRHRVGVRKDHISRSPDYNLTVVSEHGAASAATTTTAQPWRNIVEHRGSKHLSMSFYIFTLKRI